MGAELHRQIVTVRPAQAVDTIQHLPTFVGISAASAGATGIAMNLVVIPAGGASEPHYHDGYETAIFILKGRLEVRYGEDLREVTLTEAGDFLFIPAGVPHQPVNLSDTEAAQAIVARNTPSEQETVVLYEPSAPDTE